MLGGKNVPFPTPPPKKDDASFLSHMFRRNKQQIFTNIILLSGGEGANFL